MAKHEFGIMRNAPVAGQRYDAYTPKKYNCISVDDAYIEPIAEKCLAFESFCHTVDIPMKGLNYIGITLIPPTSLAKFIEIISGVDELSALSALLNTALSNGNYIIHYGL